MAETQTAYRQIMKATSIFGGVQVFQIIIGIIRSKFIAVLLGPAGMGISGLLQSTLGVISSLTNFGLSTSAVKNVSAAYATDNTEELNRVTTIFRRLVWFTGMLGVVLTLLLSPYLSQITFGNKKYTWAFVILSITLLINQISAAQDVLIRGMRRIKYMAQSSIFGSILGLLTTIPLYYIYGVQGIVPALIIASISSLALSWYFASKLSVERIIISWKDIFGEGKEMLYMGFMISLSGTITMFFSYGVRIFISNYGSVNDVGLYNAGFAIINTYVGMVFTAMSTDYFPRLSALAHKPEQANQIINQQAEIAILILSPVLMVFIVFIKWIIFILYSTAFLPIQNMMLFAAVGILFKALSWAIAFLFLSKSASKLFFWNELITNVYMLLFNLAGYFYYGLTGLGVSFLASYILYTIQVYLVSNIFFHYKMSAELAQIFIIQLILIFISLAIVLYVTEALAYILGSLLLSVSIAHSIFHLNKRMNFIAYFERH